MRFFALLFLVLFSGPIRADIEPGIWELTISASVDGMAGGVQPMTQTRCLTQADSRDPTRLIGASGCTLSNQNDTGSQISFNVSCGGQVPMARSGVVHYTPQSLNGQIDLGAEVSPGQKMITRSTINGRRIGGC